MRRLRTYSEADSRLNDEDSCETIESDNLGRSAEEVMIDLTERAIYRKHSIVKVKPTNIHCDPCDKDVSYKNWAKHTKTSKHIDASDSLKKLIALICDVCDEQFDTNSDLKDHIRSDHKNAVSKSYRYLCDACDEYIRNKYKRSSHIYTKKHYNNVLEQYPEYFVKGTNDINPIHRYDMILCIKHTLEDVYIKEKKANGNINGIIIKNPFIDESDADESIPNYNVPESDNEPLSDSNELC